MSICARECAAWSVPAAYLLATGTIQLLKCCFQLTGQHDLMDALVCCLTFWSVNERDNCLEMSEILGKGYLHLGWVASALIE